MSSVQTPLPTPSSRASSGQRPARSSKLLSSMANDLSIAASSSTPPPQSKSRKQSPDSLDHFSPIRESSDVDLSEIYTHPPEELIDKALKSLQDAGIELIEWSSLLYRRLNVPVVIKDHHYLVSDEQLEAACDLLSEDQALPQSQPPPLLIKSGGDFYTKAHMYRVTHYTSLALAQHLVLYPASLAAFSPKDLSPAPRITSLANPLCQTVIVPSEPAVYASIIRMMQRYSRFAPERIWLESDLQQLINYDFYDLEGGYVDIADKELCEQLKIDERKHDAVQIVEKWQQSQTADGDNTWINILLGVLSDKTRIEDIPRKTPSS